MIPLNFYNPLSFKIVSMSSVDAVSEAILVADMDSIQSSKTPHQREIYQLIFDQVIQEHHIPQGSIIARTFARLLAEMDQLGENDQRISAINTFFQQLIDRQRPRNLRHHSKLTPKAPRSNKRLSRSSAGKPSNRPSILSFR